MPEPFALFSKRCGDRRILSGDGNMLRRFSEDCCGPSECLVFWRFVPCNPESPDPACTPPPEFGEVWICRDLLCTADSPYRPGQPLGTGSGIQFLVIRYEGQCWRHEGGADRPNLPPGAIVIEAGEFECLGRFCEDSDCGTVQYAEAVPCDPNYNGQRPLYCPAGLPFSCSAINPGQFFPGAPNACFTFRRDAPVQQYPIGTPILYFEPGGPWVEGRTCCNCNCVGGPPIPNAYCPGFSPGGYCCPSPAAYAASPFVVDAFWRIDLNSEQAGYPPGLPYFSELRFTSLSTAGAPTLTVAYRTVVGFDGNNQPIIQEGFNAIDAPIQTITCPLSVVSLQPGGPNLFPNAPEIFDSCFELRTYNRWTGSWTGRNTTSDVGVFNQLQFQWNVRVLSPEPPGCSNINCEGAQPVMAPATDNGGVRIRGGGSRQTDPAVAAFMRQHYGGCRGCGESPNPV